MAKREIWEDIITAIDNISKENTSNKSLIRPLNPDTEGHLDPGDNPMNAQGINLNDFNSIPLHHKIKEIDWDSIDIEFNDQEEWPQEQICPEREAQADNQKNNYNGCAEEYDRLAEEIRGNDDAHLFERCAWYQSYHYSPRTFWGIHILEDCLITSAKFIYRYNNSKTKADALKSSFLYIFCHELFHYMTDNAASLLELAQGRPGLYVNYAINVYQKDFIHPGALEEALANRYLYGRYDFCRINRRLLYHMLKGMPKGYRDFDHYNTSRFWQGRRKLINQIHTSLSSPATELPLEQILEILNQKAYISGHRVPIWMHTRKGTIARIIFK